MIILRAVVRKLGDIQNVIKIVKDPMSGREAVTVNKVLRRVPSVKFVSLGNVDVKLPGNSIKPRFLLQNRALPKTKILTV